AEAIRVEGYADAARSILRHGWSSLPDRLLNRGEGACQPLHPVRRKMARPLSQLKGQGRRECFGWTSLLCGGSFGLILEEFLVVLVGRRLKLLASCDSSLDYLKRVVGLLGRTAKAIEAHVPECHAKHLLV